MTRQTSPGPARAEEARAGSLVGWLARFAVFTLIAAFAGGGCSGERERPSTGPVPAPGISPVPSAAALGEALGRRGFRCASTGTGGAGIQCRGHIPGYSQPIRILAPGDFHPRNPFGLAYHFHGWRVDGAFDPFLPVHGDFDAYLERSRRNALLVIPESTGRDDTYAHELGTPPKVRGVLERIDTLLREVGVPIQSTTPRAISVHSGAYVLLAHMGEWAARGEIPLLAAVRGVALLDAAYGYRDGLREWGHLLRRHPGSVYWLAFNPSDGSEGKRETYRRLVSELRTIASPRVKGGGTPTPDVVELPDSAVAHMDFVPRSLPEFLARALP